MRRLIVVDDPKAWTLGGHDGDVVSVSEYLAPAEPWPSRGVRVFNTAEGERVVSVSRLRDVNDDENGDDDGEGNDPAAGEEETKAEGAGERPAGDDGEQA